MPDFLLELRSEEIPARMQRQAAADLERLFTAELTSAGLAATSIESFVTPRRLALIARGLPAETAAASEELKGPRTSAPPQALEGFLRKTGLTQGQLEDRDGFWFAMIDSPGRKTSDVLASAIRAIVANMPWPKSMRWGVNSVNMDSLRWVRPLQGIVALLGGEVVQVEIGGVASGRTTRGHRFMSAGDIEITGADDYAAKLRAAHVIVSSEERAAIIADAAHKAASDAGLELIDDDGLTIENAGLTEWPVPLLGHFDPAFLDVPPEVVQLTMRTNQKYFALRDATGTLAPAFICTANIEASDGGKAIALGNQKVLAARLADARFFWEQDCRKTLAEHAEKLGEIVFHEKLGTVADKVERVAKLARWLVEEGIVGPSLPIGERDGERGRGKAARASTEAPPLPDPLPKGAREKLADLAEQAARLCKADLTTGMVGEFPELQGIMGGHYARAEGLPPEVADAIRDHYKPVGQDDEVPTAPVTVAVSLADKLDTLVAFFHYNELPTGSKDPFALRRAAISTISLLIANSLSTRLLPVVDYIVDRLAETWKANLKGSSAFPSAVRDHPTLGRHVVTGFNLLDFFADRLKVQQREAGVRHDLIDAAFALGGEDDLVRLLARVKALQNFIGTQDGEHLLVGYRRAANILTAEAKKGPLPKAPATLGYAPEPAEAALIAALDTAEPKAAAAVETEDFEGAMSALASLRAPIDAFFDSVTVNDADPNKRASRLALLERVRAAVHRVADFSRIEG